MAEQKRQPTAESHLQVSVTVTQTVTKRHKSSNRNYPTLKINQGKETIHKYINGTVKMIEHNYRNITR